ncbi:hypothetical protein HHI36_006396, partial [Cryptolaemus montrouzieri]
VAKILYRKKSDSEVDPMERSSIEMDGDDSEYMDELDDKQGATGMPVIIETDDHGACIEMVPKYNDLLQKVRRVKESTLLTADIVLKFIIDKLGQQDNVLSNDLSDALLVKIKERRTIVTGILTYLHNRKKYEKYLRQADDTFFMPKKNIMRHERKKIMSQFLSDENVTKTADENIDSDSDSDSMSLSPIEKNITLKEELENQILQEKKGIGGKLKLKKKQIMRKYLKRK